MNCEQRAVDEQIEYENEVNRLNDRLDYLSEKIELAEALGLNTSRLMQRFEDIVSELYDVEKAGGHDAS